MSYSGVSIDRFGEISDLVKSYYPDADLDLIRAAYVFSAQVHKGQMRRSGEPYLVHPVGVAKILARMKLDESTIATGLLHDTVEDTRTTIEQIDKYFGEEVALLVDGVTKISKMAFQSKEERQVESFRKMILAMSRDIRVLLVKLADRLHNMRTLDSMPDEAKRRISQETLDIYAPLAGRLGIYWIKTELEDHSFSYLEPETCEKIRLLREETLNRDEEFIKNVIEVIRHKLDQYHIKATTYGRTKEVFSVFRKMKSQNLEFDKIHDLTAFRIVLGTEAECYAVVGAIHSLWRPVPGRFKDYIAMPKNNGYQSLHTTVIGPEGSRIEIQIRTREMDLVADEGIAAHWSYKEGKTVDPKDAKVIKWLREIMETWQQDLDDPREFFEHVRVDLYPDEVYVFTPKGDVKELPTGSTPLDFAYSIHSEVGHSCVGARVNGVMVPLKYELRTGDSVEIMTSVRQHPSRDWLKHVKTAKAKNKIRHYLMAAERAQAIQIGRETTDRELRKWRLDLSRAEKNGEIMAVAREHNLQSEADFYAAVGHGRISPKIVITKIIPPSEREKAKTGLHEDKGAAERKRRSRSGVSVEGLSDMMVKFAKCCSPLPGDPLKGFITRGRGVTVHKADCPNLEISDVKRFVNVTWDGAQDIPRVVRLRVMCENRRGMLETLSGVFTSHDADIVQAVVEVLPNELGRGTFSVNVRNLEHLNRVIAALRSLSGVEKVDRLGT